MPTLVPELADRAIVLNGVAKTYAMTGWRVGWLIGPPDMVEAATNLQSHLTSNVANVTQRAALAAVAGGLDDVAVMRTEFDRRGEDHPPDAQRHRRRDLHGARRARSTPTRRSRACSAGRSPADARRPRSSCAEVILEEAKVAIVPGEAFGAPGYARLSFALGDDDLRRRRPPHRRPADVSVAAVGVEAKGGKEGGVARRHLTSGGRRRRFPHSRRNSGRSAIAIASSSACVGDSTTVRGLGRGTGR